MRDGGGGSGLTYPQGDPGTISAAAAALNSFGATLSGAAGQVSGAASGTTGYWQGPAASAFGTAVSSVRDGLDRLAGHQQDAAGALSAYAAALTAAQHAATVAGQNYQSAQADYGNTVSSLSANPPTGPQASAQLYRAQTAAADKLNGAFNVASTQASNACTDATNAARVCAAKLSQVAADSKDTALHKFLDLMGGPASVFGALGVISQVQSAQKLYSVLEAFDHGNWDFLSKVNPKGWADVAAVESKFSSSSLEALNAQMKYMENLAGDGFTEMARAAIPIDNVTHFSGFMDFLGKAGFPLAVAGDVLTLADGRATGLDRGLSGANLAGLGLAATGTEAGGAALALVGVNAVADWIPVVGEVVVAGTAAYLAGEWIYNHWGDITNWAGDAGHALATGYHDVTNFVGNVNQDAQQLVNAGLHDAQNLGTGAVHEGEKILSGAGNVAKSVVSDLNPLNW